MPHTWMRHVRVARSEAWVCPCIITRSPVHIYAWWLIHMCDESFQTWLIHMRNTFTHFPLRCSVFCNIRIMTAAFSELYNDTIACSYLYIKTHSYVSWLIQNATHSYVWLIHLCDDSFMCVMWSHLYSVLCVCVYVCVCVCVCMRVCECVFVCACVCVSHLYNDAIACLYMWHDSFICVMQHAATLFDKRLRITTSWIQ